MKPYFRSIAFLLICLSISTAIKANRLTAPKDTVNQIPFSVSKVLGSNMVVQRDKPFKIWGHAPTGHTVQVKASWNKKAFKIAVSDGNWEIMIPAAAATATPQTINISDNGANTITFSNILIGEVWLCSGQSNMEMPLDSVSGFPGFPGITNYKAEIAAANYPGIRLITIPYSRKDTPTENIEGNPQWAVCSPETVKKYSAIAYFFGRRLHETLNVPVGLVLSALSATSCEEWTSSETLEADKELKAFYTDKKCSKLYNGKIYPLSNLTIKGFLWDQGEGNRNNPKGLYTKLSAAMIKNWRDIFKQEQLPFYYVQMTPYAAKFFVTKPWGDDPLAYDYASFREDQARIRDKAPNTGMAVNMDIDEITSIHWLNKKPTGERLAFLALNKTYGQKSVQSVGPQFLGFSINSNKIIINYVKGTANGLSTATGQPLKQHFYVAGTDSVFRKANATISGETVVLSVPADTPLPVKAVRYAYTNFPVTNLQNSAGLPAEPFRTDNWINK